MGNILRKWIGDSAELASLFLLLADKSKNASKKEQLAIGVRYVDDVIYERSLHLWRQYVWQLKVWQHTCTHIEYWLDPACRDLMELLQWAGIQQQLREVSPCALCIHCYLHKPNLALVDCLKSIQFPCDFFCLLEALYVFISTSKAVFVAKQKELHIEKQLHQLQKLSAIHWACQQGAANSICCTYNSVIATLEEDSGGADWAKAVQATSLLREIKNFADLVSSSTYHVW